MPNQTEKDHLEANVGTIWANGGDGDESASLAQMPDKELGALLREYVEESVHQGFDGFNESELEGVKSFLRDMTIYMRNWGRKTD